MAPAAVVLGLGLGQVAVIVVNVIGEAVGGSTLRHPSPAVSLISDVVFDLAFVARRAVLRPRVGRAAAGRLRLPRTAARPGGRGARRAPASPTTCSPGPTRRCCTCTATTSSRRELGVNHSTAALVGAAVFVCVIAPMAEEFFFRGFLLRVLSRDPLTRRRPRQRGPWVAAVISGVLFGLAHTGSASPEYLVPLGFLGFVLCLVRWRTGSLYPCMALHSLNNSLALGVNQLHWNAPAILGADRRRRWP